MELPALLSKATTLSTSATYSIAIRIQHYLVASCSCLRDWAAVLGEEMAAFLLQESLDDARASEASLLNLARAEGITAPAAVSSRESILPLARVLSGRELEVLHWLAEGISARESCTAQPAVSAI